MKIKIVEWDDSEKGWVDRIISAEEHHGSVECRYCGDPVSHNVKVDGEYRIVYARCRCARVGGRTG